VGGELRPFRLRTPLLSAGRSHTILAETDRMTVAIKNYAQGGENALHAHPDEDHVFVVLQGEATYHDAEGQALVLGRHEGVLVPHGVLYRFESSGDEQLVLLRTGAGPREQTYHRVGPDGEVIPARSAANRYEEPVPIPGQFFE
jgi:mannose-6-phosphate isomerase-like protein (cupin superfamily)